MRGAGRVPGDAGGRAVPVGFTVVWASLAAVNAFYSIQIVALGGSTGPGRDRLGGRGEPSRCRSCTRSRGSAARFGTERLVVIGSLAFALRALLASLVVDPVALVLVAPLEGIGFACVFVGGVTVRRRRGRRRGCRAPRRACSPPPRAGHDHRLGRRRRDRRRTRDPGPVPGRARSVSLVGTAIVAVALARPDGTRARIPRRPDRRRNRWRPRCTESDTTTDIEEDPPCATFDRSSRPSCRLVWRCPLRAPHGQGRGRDVDLRRAAPGRRPAGQRGPDRLDARRDGRRRPTLPFSAEGVFVRLTPASGPPLEVVARQDRAGHYIAIGHGAGWRPRRGGHRPAGHGVRGQRRVHARGRDLHDCESRFARRRASDRPGRRASDTVQPHLPAASQPRRRRWRRIRPFSSSRCWPV